MVERKFCVTGGVDVILSVVETIRIIISNVASTWQCAWQYLLLKQWNLFGLCVVEVD